MTHFADESVIAPRLRRPLTAVWVSLGLHAAVIALVQVAPPVSTGPGGPVIEARLVTAHAEPVVEDGPDASSDTVSPLAPIESDEPMQEAHAPVPIEPAQRPAPEVAMPPVVSAATSPFAITSTVDLTFYGAREVDVLPRALHEIVPDYPEEAERQKVSGKVRLQLKLEADGRVVEAEVVHASPPGMFDDAAVKAFRAAHFVPALKNGRPVRALVMIELTFDWEGRPR